MSKDSYHLSLEKLTRPVLVKKSPRAKRMTLRVSPTKRDVILTVPKSIGPRKAGDFIKKHINWLKQQIDDLPEPVPFKKGAVIPFEGEPHILSFEGPHNKQAKTRSVIKLLPQGPEDEMAIISVVGTREHAPRRLTDWLKKQARQNLSERVSHHAERLKLTYSKIGVRDQTSRWGSCSSNGTLSFSWRLIFAPPLVLDYVAAHEVAHLKEMNHSARFWKLVAKTMPEHEVARKWLRHNGQDLHRYGASD